MWEVIASLRMQSRTEKTSTRDLVLSDQYESPLEGRQFSACGNDVSTQNYRDGILLCNAVSFKISVIHQVGLTGTETVQAKLQFEREAAAVGIHVKEYCTDNGIKNSEEFPTELILKGKAIYHSDVGGHHHNGVAENAIKNVVRTSLTMMIHGALRWPEHNENDLWPLALSHVVHLHN